MLQEIEIKEPKGESKTGQLKIQSDFERESDIERNPLEKPALAEIQSIKSLIRRIAKNIAVSLHLTKLIFSIDKRQKLIDVRRGIGDVMIEVSSFCQLECVHCYREQGEYDSRNINMKLGVFKKIIDELGPIKRPLSGIGKKRTITLQGVGEPTLNPKIKRMIEYSSNAGFEVILGTNLTTLSFDKFSKLMNSGIDKLLISIDTLNRENIPSTRTLTDVDKLVNNFTKLSEEFNHSMYVRTAVSKINMNDMLEIKNLLLKNNISMENWLLQPIELFESNEFGLDNKDVEIVNEMIGCGNKLSLRELPITKTTCREPNTLLNINATGHVMPCCHYCDDKIINFGNVEHNSIKEIYGGTKLEEFREKLYYSNDPPSECKDCLFR